ncbi:MAG: FAD-dependent oxidoreductase, partial [Pseudomonadota bacterium]|nr:FAD-dependent oxidoreductase [Pseudomonadota bacterium]
MNELTEHNARAADDYQGLAEFGIRTIRESVGWRLAERNENFDFACVEGRARAAHELGIQVIWTLCHYGMPRDVDPFAPDFIERFSRYCRAAARFLCLYTDGPGLYNPINEISFFSWALTETGLMHPYRGDLQHRAFELKRQLVRAAIAGCRAIREIAPGARMVNVDPLIHIVAPLDRPDREADAIINSDHQFQAFDMLAGRLEPELGGSPDTLDIVGVNYYHSNQWEIGTKKTLEWHIGDPRRVALSDLLERVWGRYRRPLLLAETSHVGAGRGAWILGIAEEVARAEAAGVDVAGICLYPIIDRPDWENPAEWHKSGLWDLRLVYDEIGVAHFRRVLDMLYARDLKRAQARLSGVPAATCSYLPKGKKMSPLIVFSHLRWDFVYQRPQHLLTRLAEDQPVIFFEEPVYAETTAWLEEICPAPNVRVLRPHTSVPTAGFCDDQLPELRRLLRGFLEREGYARSDDHRSPSAHDYLAWFYTPMALPLLQELTPRAVVFDCMDELSAFKNAPRQLLQRENALMAVANVVFTGGRSLYRIKQSRHPNVHCFPSSVDRPHFAQALDRQHAHPALDAIPHPRLGFFGVIDERLDVQLISRVADARPDWQIVIVGPVVKIDPASLPRRSNIHYFGQQAYADLPRFLAGWDLCLLPFALNESTRFISPTKTLEYMAAELPIVSTPVTDVAELYSGIVAIASDADAFIAACLRLLQEDDVSHQRRVEAMRTVVAQTSWDETVRQMRSLLEAAAAEGLNEAALRLIAHDEPPEREAPVMSVVGGRRAYDHVVIGAGPTGLAAAYHLGERTLLLERNAGVGGWCRSVVDKGFTFDYAGHIMFSNDPYVQELYQKLLGDNLHWQQREAWIHSKKEVYTRYPFQGALYGLPPDVLKECIIGAIEARFGPLETPKPTEIAKLHAVHVDNDATSCKTNSITDCCADGITAEVPLVVAGDSVGRDSGEHKNFEDFIYNVWGAGVAKHFAIPYNKKLWAVPLSQMETSWLGGRVPLPNLEEMIDGALRPVAKPMGPNARFGYPLKGGFQALMDGFLPHLKGTLELNASVARISIAARTVTLSDGRGYRYKSLISTMPLPELVRALGEEAPESVKQAASELRYVSVRCVNLGIGRSNLTEKHWIYYPDDPIFHRIFVQGNASPHCNPAGGFGL